MKIHYHRIIFVRANVQCSGAIRLFDRTIYGNKFDF